MPNRGRHLTASSARRGMRFPCPSDISLPPSTPDALLGKRPFCRYTVEVRFAAARGRCIWPRPPHAKESLKPRSPCSLYRDPKGLAVQSFCLQAGYFGLPAAKHHGALRDALDLYKGRLDKHRLSRGDGTPDRGRDDSDDSCAGAVHSSRSADLQGPKTPDHRTVSKSPAGRIADKTELHGRHVVFFRARTFSHWPRGARGRRSRKHGGRALPADLRLDQPL